MKTKKQLKKNKKIKIKKNQNQKKNQNETFFFQMKKINTETAAEPACERGSPGPRDPTDRRRPARFGAFSVGWLPLRACPVGRRRARARAARQPRRAVRPRPPRRSFQRLFTAQVHSDFLRGRSRSCRARFSLRNRLWHNLRRATATESCPRYATFAIIVCVPTYGIPPHNHNSPGTPLTLRRSPIVYNAPHSPLVVANKTLPTQSLFFYNNNNNNHNNNVRQN